MSNNSPQKPLEILLVDDDRSILRANERIVGILVEERLKNRDYHIDKAQDGAEALEKVKKKDYDLIITDYNMPPGKNGVEFYQELKDIKPKQREKVVFSTANVDDLKEVLSRTKLKESGIDTQLPYIIEKPVPIEEFEKVISLYIK